MKKILFAFIITAGLISSASAIIWIDETDDSGITNLTNNGTNLQPWVPQITGQSAPNLLDWLNNDNGSTFVPGQIEQYNSIEGKSLIQAGSLAFTDGSISTSGLNGTYMFAVGTYYVAAHWGGFNTAHLLVVTDATEKYGLVADLNGTGKDNSGGGSSVIAVWNGGGTTVPDSGSSLILLGLGLGLLGFIKRRK